jgi:tetratricopeptide (TPR) repeat protein
VGRIRKNVICWAIVAGLSAWGSPAGAQAEALTKADQKALIQIGAAAEAGDCALVLKRAEPFVKRRKGVLPNDLTVTLYDAIAACHIEANRNDEAYSAALSGTALAESTPKLWQIRLFSEIARKRWTDVAATLEAMTQGHGATLNDLPIPVMWELLDGMKKDGAAETRTRVLKLLASDSYAPSETFGSNDGFRLLYAQDRIAAGDTAAAGPVIARLEDPSNIANASLDPRMRGYLASTDLAAAATRRLARHREWVAREPDRLRPLIAAATNLRQLGRAKEALDLLRSAEPRLDKLTETEDSDHVNWWWNELALTYEALHRPDEAVEAYRNGSKASEDGVPNVSQLINLALAQLRFGRPRDALATIALRDLSAKGASPYGIMLYRRARACALHLEGRGGEAKADVDYVVSHEKDAPVAVTELHLCLDDMDSAAASVIRRLEDPEQRPVMLLELSDFDLAPPPLPTDRNARNREALKKREDVKAAIARAGGTRRFNVAEA